MTVKELEGNTYKCIIIFKDYNVSQNYNIVEDNLRTLLKNVFPLNIKKVLLKQNGTLDFEELVGWQTLLDEEEKEKVIDRVSDNSIELLLSFDEVVDVIFEKINEIIDWINEHNKDNKNKTRAIHTHINELYKKIENME